MKSSVADRILKRQLKKAKIIDFENISRESFEKLIDMFKQSYDQMHDDRYILERSLELSSREMSDLNATLEDKVKQKTKELADLNRNLEKRVLKEIDKNMRQQQMMVQQSRLAQMGEMISMIAHQWRQPLTAISSVATSLTLKLILDDFKKDFFEKQLGNIMEYSQHLSSTIDDFRGFFKEGKSKNATSLEKIVQITLSIVQPSIEGKGINISTQYDCNKEIFTYENEIKQVVLNLIKNSEDAILENKIKKATILIKTYIKDNFGYIDIKDNGGGISNDIIKDIFIPYFTTKDKLDGTGLGLYMSKTIIEDHCKGKLIVSTKDNTTTMKIKLPLD